MSILLAHEMGHYLMCRQYGVPATLPFFIPMPKINPFGTMGAIIQMKGAIPNRKALFDIGAAGPIAGLILSIPAIYIGMQHSEMIEASQMDGYGLVLGESLMFKAIAYLAVGRVPENYDTILHPLAYAGWAGLFVTSLNLLPIGQLDGGHIMYSLLGKKSNKTNLAFLVILASMIVYFPGWAVLFGLLLIFGRRHPAPVNDVTPLDVKRRILGILVFIIFLMSFTPVPLKLNN
ncbi:site-2 protease family protein [candidate division KSB1 bacterium]|nr:site-2 protease family protein [candidate division KSB1 bacterium]